LLTRALAIKERLHGPAHPDVALTIHNLGLLYVSQGQPEKAEPLYRRALAIREKALAPAHPDTVKSLEELAGVLRKLRREGEAAALDARAYELRARRS
jgi:Tfp pilus assembly protein PilF